MFILPRAFYPSAMEISQALTHFGFTQVESLVYHELLRHSPATGYRLARQLNKAPPNIYQTIQSLLQKGAILTLDTADGPQSYIAVPPRQLFAGIKAKFEEHYETSLQALEDVYAPTRDETVYQLRTVTQVFERAKAMIAGATEILLFDMVPAIYDLLRDDFDAARARGIRVIGIAYRPEDALPTVPYNGEDQSEVVSRWPGLGMILIIDGREQLIAQIARELDQVLNAVYSDSIFLSSILHSAVSSDIRLVALHNDPSDPLRDLGIKHHAPPGLRAMNAADAMIVETAPDTPSVPVGTTPLSWERSA